MQRDTADSSPRCVYALEHTGYGFFNHLVKY